MKKLILAAAILAIPAVSTAEVIAKYNGIPVTREEIDKSLALIAPVDGASTKLANLPPDFQKNLIEKFIENKLIIDAARKKGLHRDPVIVAKIRDAESYLIQEKYLTTIIKQQSSEAKLKALYDEKYKGKEGAQEVQAQHILVKTESEAQAVKKQLDNGADFGKLAKEKSVDPGAKVSGGDLGFFTADQMVPEFSKVAFATKPGTISEPVKTDFGWHVIKVLARKTKEIPPYDTIKDQLNDELAVNIIHDESERLFKAANVQYLGTAAKLAATPAPAANPKVMTLKDGKLNEKETSAGTKPAPKAAPKEESDYPGKKK